VTDPGVQELLPSVERLLKRAGALECILDVDVQAIWRLPVFQTHGWKRSIVEFLRWSGSTPDPGASSSVLRLVLGHGPAGARALFEAYRYDRLERAATFEEADAQLEAVRTIVNMAAHWVHAIDWDLRAAPRLSLEEFRNRRRGRLDLVSSEPDVAPGEQTDPRFSDLVEGLLRDPGDGSTRHESRPSATPVYPAESSGSGLWKRPKEP
jgi:hypothetical protein